MSQHGRPDTPPRRAGRRPGPHRWGRLVVATWTLLAAAMPGSPGALGADEDLGAIVRRAFEASAAGLRSGRGKGTYRADVGIRAAGSVEWKTTIEADVRTFFDAGRYHIDLHYRLEPMEISDRKIAYDGAAIAVTRFSRLISRTGAETDVFPPGKGFVTRPSLAEFPWDVSNLPGNVFDLDRFGKVVVFSRDASGDIVAAYRVGAPADPTLIRCVFAKALGDNITSVEFLVEGETKVVHSFKLEWKRRADGPWHAVSLEESFFPRSGEPPFRDRFVYDEFEPNAEVDPALFTRSSLGIPPGSRIIDRRPE